MIILARMCFLFEKSLPKEIKSTVISFFRKMNLGRYAWPPWTYDRTRTRALLYMQRGNLTHRRTSRHVASATRELRGSTRRPTGRKRTTAFGRKSYVILWIYEWIFLLYNSLNTETLQIKEGEAQWNLFIIFNITEN